MPSGLLRGAFFSALFDTNAAHLKECRKFCIRSAALCVLVGYQNDTMTKNRYTLIGIPFNAMKSDGKGFDFDELNFTGVKDGTDTSDGDVAMFWTGVGWGEQFYHDEDGWWSGDDIEFDIVHPTGIEAGKAFFYQSRRPAAAEEGNVTITFWNPIK